MAVAVPLRYNRQSRGGRQLLLIGTTWLLSAAVAAPVLCGLNDARSRDPSVCRLEDRDYVVYSSVCSFFLPCPLMLLLYWATFRGLRRWEAARRAKLHGRPPRRPSGPGPPPPDGSPAPDAAVCPDAIPAPDCIPAPDATPPPDGIPAPDAAVPPDATPASDAVVPSDAMPAEPPLRARRRRRAKITGRERKAMRVLPVVVGGYRPGDMGGGEDCSARGVRRRPGRGAWQGAAHGSPNPAPRGLSAVLDALLCRAHLPSAVSHVRRAPAVGERGHLAGLRQQRPQPRHLHHLQRRVPDRLPQGSAPLLLSRPRAPQPLVSTPPRPGVCRNN